MNHFLLYSEINIALAHPLSHDVLDVVDQDDNNHRGSINDWRFVGLPWDQY